MVEFMNVEKTQLHPVRSFQADPNCYPRDQALMQWKQQNFSSLALEIGCGAGYHPIAWAKKNPDAGIIAIERTQAKFASFQTRLSSHQLPNIFPIHADARLWLPNQLDTGELKQIFTLYPNPYPKKAQANKRWHRSSLMHLLLNYLQPQGELHFASNEKWLMIEFHQYMVQFWGLQLANSWELLGRKNEACSHFEKKYLAAGDVCYHRVYCKPS